MWDVGGWTGGDINRFWWKSEGEGDFDGGIEGEVQALYSRAVSPFWDVQAGVRQDFREDDDGLIRVYDQNDKVYIEVERSGERTHDDTVIENFTRCYVAASGKNFPHTLKPLMENAGVMFNPDRPMIMYQSMSLALDTLDAPSPDLELHNAELKPDGKRGNVSLDYRLISDGNVAGEVSKKLVVSGLRDYDAGAMDAVVEEFYRLKEKSWD